MIRRQCIRTERGIKLRRFISIMFVVVFLFCNTGLSDSSDSSSKTIRARLFPENFDDENIYPVSCISDLLDVLTVSVNTSFSDDSHDYFSDTFTFSLENGTSINFTVYGSEAEWIITSPALGDVSLLLELNGLCEFSIKTYNHLGIPLQLAALLIPYIHRSGTSAVLSCINRFLPDEDGIFTYTVDELEPVCSELYSIMQSDRSFTYWLMCIGIRSGFDSVILEEAEYLCDALPETITITKNNGVITDVHSDDMTYYHSEDGSFSLLIPETPVYGYRICASGEPDPFSISVDISSELNDENVLAFSFTEDMARWHFDAEGTSLNTPVHFILDTGNTGRYVISDSEGIPLAECDLSVVQSTDDSVSFFSGSIPDDAVNVFTLNDTTLASLSDRILMPVLTNLVPFISGIPSSTCQCLMNWLSDSGILSMLLTGTGNLDE